MAPKAPDKIKGVKNLGDVIYDKPPKAQSNSDRCSLGMEYIVDVSVLFRIFPTISNVRNNSK